MELVMKQLTPELVEDFLYYFDHVAFGDHPEWAFCYCLECHLDPKQEEELRPRGIQGRREVAKEMILNGRMQGYLAYEDGNVIGWCNAADKKSYHRLCEDKMFWPEGSQNLKIKVAYCFDIAPDYRGRHIASAMLQRVCEDAASEGYQYVESYPWKEDFGAYKYHGPMKMFENYGFVQCFETPLFYGMRKTL